jgi:hypothetical protein
VVIVYGDEFVDFADRVAKRNMPPLMKSLAA